MADGTENGSYDSDRIIPTASVYLIHFSGNVLGEAVDKTKGLEEVSANGCADFPPSQVGEGSDKIAKERASAAWASSNATADQLKFLTLLVYGAGGLGGAALALAGYNAWLGRQSLAIARQREMREKAEQAADEILKGTPVAQPTESSSATAEVGNRS